MPGSNSTSNPISINADQNAGIANLLGKIANAQRVLLWDQAKETGLSPIQIQILLFLSYHPQNTATISYLAAEFSLTKPTISDAVRTLELKKLLVRKTHPHDSRSHYLHLTESAQSLIPQLENFDASIVQAVRLISPEKKTALQESLLSIFAELSDKNIISAQRSCVSCSHFQQSPEPYCKYLQKYLAQAQLRTDCPEHSSLQAD